MFWTQLCIIQNWVSSGNPRLGQCSLWLLLALASRLRVRETWVQIPSLAAYLAEDAGQADQSLKISSYTGTLDKNKVSAS